MIRPAPLSLLLLAGPALLGCRSEDDYLGAFAVPQAITATPAHIPTPFQEPVAYVADQAGGTIHALAVDSGRFLTDDPTASFLRAPPLATGRRRVLTDLTWWAPGPDRIGVLAADQAFGQLLEVPHVVGLDEDGPVEPVLTLSEVEAPPGVRLEGLQVEGTSATTDTWTLTTDGFTWWVEGDRSGRFGPEVVPGEPYAHAGLSFTLVGQAEEGATIRFSTDSGLVEHDLDGRLPRALAPLPDRGEVVVSALDTATDQGELLWWDPQAGAVARTLPLGPGSQPEDIVHGEGEIFVADSGRSVVWRVPEDGTAPAVPIELPWPVLDLTVVPEEGRLFLVPADGRSLWAVDLDSGTLVDLNPWSPGLDGFPLHGPIRGIDRLPGPSPLPAITDDGLIRTGRALAISLYAGSVVFYDLARGCLVSDGLGPRTALAGTGAAAGDYDIEFGGVEDGPRLQRNGANARHVVVNDCAGLAREELWTLTFRGDLQAWEVEGSRSGLQEALAVEDVRYVSDDGSISFLLQGGATAAVDGWTVRFSIDDGVLRVLGDRTGDGQILPDDAEIAFALPGDPVGVGVRSGDPGDGWRAEDARIHVLVPLTGQDAVARVDLATGLTSALWR